VKINIILTFIAICISALCAYAFFSISNSENKLLLSGGGFIYLSVTLFATIAAQFNEAKKTTNIKSLSGIFFTIGLISHIVFAFVSFSPAAYIIPAGLLLLAFMSLAYSISKSS
jgi:hypothetical protein